MMEHLLYVFLRMIFLIIYLSVNISISHIFMIYDFILFYFILKETAAEYKFKNKVSKEILNKAGAINMK